MPLPSKVTENVSSHFPLGKEPEAMIGLPGNGGLLFWGDGGAGGEAIPRQER